MKAEKGGKAETQEKNTAEEFNKKSLEDLITEREAVIKDLNNFIEDNQEIFSKKFKDDSVMKIPSKLFFTMTEHLQSSVMQSNLLVESMGEYLTKMRRAVAFTDMMSTTLRKKALVQIQESDMAGDLVEVKDK